MILFFNILIKMTFSERNLGHQIRTNENISFIFWKKLIQILDEMHINNYFSISYPLKYPIYYDINLHSNDYLSHVSSGQIYACDNNALSEDLNFHIDNDISWPLQMKKNDEEIDWMPSKYQVFDLIEFLYSKTNSIETKEYSSEAYYGEDISITVLKFKKNDNSAKEKFAQKINKLFSAAKMIYVFDENLGEIQAIISHETKQLIVSALDFKFFYLDSEYIQMLQSACELISNPSFEKRYDALDKLWGAFERLKCYFDPKNSKEKRASCDKILSLFSTNPIFDLELNQEMVKLTNLGNQLRIRHKEKYQETLTDSIQLNYLFSRCLAMIVLIQQQIIATKMHSLS